MEIGQPNRIQVFKYASLAVVLAVLAIGLGVVVVCAARKVPGAGQAEQTYWYYLAWTSLVLLGIVLLVLIWPIARILTLRTARSGDKHKTHYVNAWSLSGRRFQLDESDRDEGDDPREPPKENT